MPSTGQNLQPFTGHGDVSIWVKNSRVGRKATNKQTLSFRGDDNFPLLIVFECTVYDDCVMISTIQIVAYFKRSVIKSYQILYVMVWLKLDCVLHEYCLQKLVTLEIVIPWKQKVDGGFRGMTLSNVTLWNDKYSVTKTENLFDDSQKSLMKCLCL